MSSHDNRFSNRFSTVFLEISTDSIGFDLKSSEWRSEGTAVALLGVALEMIGRGTYQAPTSLTSPTVNKVPCEVHSTKPCDIQSQNWKDVPSAMQLLILMLARGQGSLKDSGNLVYALILAAQVATVRCYQMLLAVAAPHTVVASHQDTVNNWVSTKSNWPLDSIESRHVMMRVHSPQSVHSHAKLQDGLSKQGLLSLTCLPRSGRFGLLGKEGKEQVHRSSTSLIFGEMCNGSCNLWTTCGPPLSELPEEMLSKLACVWIPVSSGAFQID